MSCFDCGSLLSVSYVYIGKMLRDFKDSHTSHIFDVKFDFARIVRWVVCPSCFQLLSHVKHLYSTSHDQKIVILDFSPGLDVSLFTR